MYFKFSICFLLFVAITGNSSHDWETFKQKYNKNYASVEEETHRKQIFLENVNHMQEYQRTHPHATFRISINYLMDRRTEELISARSKQSFNERSASFEGPIQSTRSSFDWRDKGVIAPVYDQQQEADDAAVVAVETIESFQAIQSGKLERGSIQQVFACCQETTDILGCVLDKMNGSLCRLGEYNESSPACDITGCTPFAQFTHVRKLKPGDESTMLKWITKSPLFVGIDASQPTFLIYQTGIYNDENCSSATIDHVLQLVGYGTRDGTPYWICKNSWGTNWGDQGYILIERGKNICGIAQSVSQIGIGNMGSAAHSINMTLMYLAFVCFVLRLFF